MPKPATSVLGDERSHYHEWREAEVTVCGEGFRVATKPGVLSFGSQDVANLMLAEHARAAAGETVVQLNGATGLFATVAARSATRVLTADRNVLSVEAARRTFQANGTQNAEAFAGQGASSLPSGLEADLVAIRIPTEKLVLHQLLWDAFSLAKVGGRCAIAGATNEGIKSASAALEALFGHAVVVATGSGHRVVIATKRAERPASDAIADSDYLRHDVFHRYTATMRGREIALFTRPGVFSWDHVDEATALLAEAMVVNAGEHVLDLGCGAGALGITASGLSGGAPVTLVDADMEAVRSAARSIEHAGVPNARVIPSDIASAVLAEHFDVVVTNPPFHVGKATDLDVPLQFIEDAWHVLNAGGRLFLVANRTLPYERAIYQRFGNIATVHDGRRFKVLSAVRG